MPKGGLIFTRKTRGNSFEVRLEILKRKVPQKGEVFLDKKKTHPASRKCPPGVSRTRGPKASKKKKCGIIWQRPLEERTPSHFNLKDSPRGTEVKGGKKKEGKLDQLEGGVRIGDERCHTYHIRCKTALKEPRPNSAILGSIKKRKPRYRGGFVLVGSCGRSKF